MPKDVSSRSSRKSRTPHYHPYSNSESEEQHTNNSNITSSKEWEDATCPICMEYPHNAVLLLCTSHDNGCRPYMCDTSYRHSNCLDQYRRLSVRGGQCSRHDDDPLPTGRSVRMRPLRELLLVGDNNGPGRAVRETGTSDVGEQETEAADQNGSDLLCPLCRGKVVGWKVVDEARKHLNCKARNCAQESCGFAGSYEELRRHARCVHPYARPSDVDPVRQRDWRHLERERDIGDVLSTIQSAMPGARILGDYVIDEDEENEEQEEDGDENEFPGDDGNWWTVFLLFQVFGPVAGSGAGAGGASSVTNRLRGLNRGHHLRSIAAAHAHHHTHRHHGTRLWGEGIEESEQQQEGTPESETGGVGESGGEVGSSSTPVMRRRRSRQ